MTRTILSLHLRLWPRALRRNRAQIIGIVFTVLYGLGAGVAFAAWAGTSAADGTPGPLTLTPAIGVLAYWLLAIIQPSPENQLDTAQFATLPIPTRRLLPGFFLAAMLQSRSLIAVVDTAVTVGFGTWGILSADAAGYTSTGAAVLVPLWVVGNIVSLATAVLGGETLAALTGASATRRSSERMTVIISVTFVVLLVGFNLVINSGVTVGDLGPVATVVGWTPLGAAAGVTTSLATGAWVAAAGRVLVAVATVVLAGVVWTRATASSLTRVAAGQGPDAGDRKDGTVLLRWVPGGPTGTLYSRMMRYWRRDSRLLPTLFMAPAVVVAILVLGATQDSGFASTWGVSIILFFVLGLTSNDFGMDGPSNWVHMSVGVRGRHLVLARAATAATVFMPLAAVLIIGRGVLEGFTTSWAATAAVTACGVVIAISYGAAASSRFPTPAPKPGSNPMRNSGGGNATTLVVLLSAFIVIGVPLVPGSALMATASGPGVQFWAGLAVDVVVTVLMTAGGLAYAARRADRRWPEIFTAVRSWT